MKEQIKKIVRETLLEIDMALGGSGWDSNNDVQSFHGYPSGYGQFPDLHIDSPETLPSVEEINNDNTKKFNDFMGNNEVYEFPMETFKKGLEFEKNEYKKAGVDYNIFDVSVDVINNIQRDKNFYEKA